MVGCFCFFSGQFTWQAERAILHQLPLWTATAWLIGCTQWVCICVQGLIVSDVGSLRLTPVILPAKAVVSDFN